jgi:hypothetical protein
MQRNCNHLAWIRSRKESAMIPFLVAGRLPAKEYNGVAALHPKRFIA